MKNQKLNKKIGNLGENIAKEYLKKNNIYLIKSNFYSRYGEVDIIASNDEYILFIEVKTSKSLSAIPALERVDFYKQKKILKTAQVYLLNYPSEKQVRFDVIEINLKFNKNKGAIVNHIKNAF